MKKNSTYWEIRTCEVCGKDFEVRKKVAKRFCSKECRETYQKRPENIEKRMKATREAVKEKYGVDNTFQVKEVQDKVKNTFNKKYGGSPMNSEEVVEKIKSNYKNKSELEKKHIVEKRNKTKLERYGNENYNNIDKIKESNSKLDKDLINEKRRKTNLERHGVDNLLKLEENKVKAKEKVKELYGTKVYQQSEYYKNKKALERFNRLKDRMSDNGYKLNNLDVYENNRFNAELECMKCGNTFTSTQVTYNKDIFCRKCVPVEKNVYENEIYEYIKSIYNGDIIKNDREIIKPKEIDILIPERKLGVEFNGIFWHTEEYGCDKNYHINKTNSMNSNGYELLHFFEDEWLNKKDIVKSILSSKLGVNDKVYARKCVIKEIDSKTSKKFLEDNHLQGSVNSSVKIGLFYNNELVSLMTFGKLRKSLGTNHNEEYYELYRYCNKLYTNVIGGASKLLNYFIKKYTPNKVITYANLRYSNGNLYNKLGFKYVSITEPGYFYVNNHKRYHRYNFRKNKLVEEGFDSSKTEKQIMKERGYLRIWDCGNIKYEL